MCGIIGYTGNKKVTEILLKGLTRLEYRGYDSAGVAVITDKGLEIRKKQGKLAVLKEDLKKTPITGSVGIGHTRWATHGAPNDTNAHPHFDRTERLAIAHNGIIENYQMLKKELEKNGCKFLSETDSEVIAHLIGSKYKGDLMEAVRRSVRFLEGSYSLAVVHEEEPERIIGVRKDSPLIVGIGSSENFIASDIPAVLEHTKDVIYLDNEEIISISKGSYEIYNFEGKKLSKKISTIKWDISQAEKMGYRHFMMKEICEQPEVLRGILKERIRKDEVIFDELKITKKQLKAVKKITIVACGTAYHAGLTGKYVIEKYAKIPVWVDTSSEFRYRDPLVDESTLTIVISQSGETADTLAALREAKKRKSTVLAICNVVGSSIDREADGVIYTHAGSEIAVASTKAYTAQLAALYLFAHYLSDEGENSEKNKQSLKELKKIPKAAKKVIEAYHSKKKKIAKYANEFHEYYLARNNKSCFLYLGRNINYPNALEGALKLKEISYISAEGYPAGEMKHGPIALIDENPWVVCIAVAGDTYGKMISNVQEIKARGGIVIAVVSEGDTTLKEDGTTYVVEVPKIEEIFSPLVVIIPLQLLAYYVAEEFGYDIDQPRNLAKSVTVE